MKRKVVLTSLVLLMLVSCEKEIYIGINESLPTTFGKIYVSSNPTGYKIYIDDKNWSVTTPDTVLWLMEGNHKLTLKHNFFSDSSLTINAKKSVVNNYNLNMMQNPRFFAKIFCSTTPPNAKIYFNDQYTNYSTPSIISNVYPGYYEIKFQKFNCRDDSSTYLIKGGSYILVERTLEDTTRLVSYRMNNSPMASNLLTKVAVDKKNNKWIGTLDHGLMKFDGKQWANYEDLGLFVGSRIQDLLIDKKDRLWVASAKGLYVFDGISWQSLTDKLPFAFVTALAEDANGNIWIANFDALIKYDNSSFQVFTSKNTGVQLNNLWSIAASSNGDVWIGSFTWGIILFDGKKFSQFTLAKMGIDSSISDEIQDLIVDKNNNLYAYCMADPGEFKRSAVIKFNGTKWEELNMSLLFKPDVSSFYNDDDNNIWMTYNGGIVKYNDTKPLWFYDSDTNGFFSKLCSSFCIDRNGDGWLTTLGGGIAKLKKGFF